MIRPSIAEALALSVRLGSNPGDAPTLAPMLADAIRMLPPRGSELLSRPAFQRATLWTMASVFERIPPGAEFGPINVMAQRDLWIRGVEIQAYLAPVVDGDPTLPFQRLRRICGQAGTNLRGLIDCNWRIDGQQGFISSGQSEILGRGSLLGGDSAFSVDLDWQLQKTQTIEVRLRNRVRDFLPAAAEGVTDLDRTIRYACVAFWGEELRNPSAQV